MKRLLAALLFALTLPVSAQSFTPVEGTYSNPNEPGTAYAIAVHNGRMIVTIYSYLPDGQAQWYLVACDIDEDYTCTGKLEKYEDGQSIGGSYVPPVYAGSDGTAKFEWVAEARLKVALPQKRVTTIVPYEFATFFGPRQLLGKWVFIAFSKSGKTISTDVLDFDTLAGDGERILAPAQEAECRSFPAQIFRCQILDKDKLPVAVWTVHVTLNSARGSSGNALDRDVVVQGYRLDPATDRNIPD